MLKTYLVTGGLGFIGAPLVRALAARGDTVRVFDNASRGSVEKLGDAVSKVEIVEGDIRNARAVNSVVKGVDSVIHLAFVNGTEYFYDHPEYVLDVGVKGMVNVIDACVRNGVRDMVLASSSEVYQTPPSVPTNESAPLSVPDPLNSRYSYGGGKIISELMALNYGHKHFDRVTIFRPHNVYGPMMGYEHVIPQFVLRMLPFPEKKGAVAFPIQGDGKQTRSFIYIDDFTDGLLRVIDKGEHRNIYHIGTMEEVTIARIAEEIAAILGLHIALQKGEEAKGGTLRRCPDISKLQSLGFVPRFSLQEGLQKTVAWYKQHPHPPTRTRSTPEIFLSSL
jgi:nucleoside-diphosphate-sugar epimerase